MRLTERRIKISKATNIIILFVLIACNISFAQNIANLSQPYWITPRVNDTQHIDLSGKWELSYMDNPINSTKDLANRKDIFQTEIPNSVQWSYYKAGKLPNPYEHLNSHLYKWIEEKAWYYQKEIIIPFSVKGNSLILCFDGIDYFSKLWVNDSLVGQYEGMYAGPVTDISSLIKYGEKNKITVEVKAGNWGNIKGYNPWKSGKIIKPWVISGGLGAEPFYSLGMWQGARIEIVPEIHIERPFLTTQEISAEKARLNFALEILAGKNTLNKELHPWHNRILNLPNEKGRSFVKIKEKITVIIDFFFDSLKVLSKEYNPDLYMGENWLEEEIIIDNPKIWNPVGLGDPNLYQVQVSLIKNGIVIDKLKFDFGVRKIDHVRNKGPRTHDRWENWQFIINGHAIFVKGMNWQPIDVLLETSETQYRWVLEAAKNMGIQLIRVWGGGYVETDIFYKICNELGIMIWQDFPIGNQETPEYPQESWETLVIQNILRLRNHPSLVVWCGGNEFNPYSKGNAATLGIVERNINIFDNSRLYLRTSPDNGSVHLYPDMDPCWYNRSYKFEPFITETGIHSLPESNLFYELVDKNELMDLGTMWDKDFPKTHPEFIHHFVEYKPDRIPRMLSRASHIIDLENPSIENLVEATQIGAGEFYQILSEKMQGNYPITTGLLPWVFKRSWPTVGIQMMDGLGQVVAPYYFLKRTYEETHVAVDLERLFWKPGEEVEIAGSIIHAGMESYGGKLSVTVFDDKFQQVWKKDMETNIGKGPFVSKIPLGKYQIPIEYGDRYLFVLVELKGNHDNLISRSFYYPRVLTMLEDEKLYNEYLNTPVKWITLEKGPWLKSTVSATSTNLKTDFISQDVVSPDRLKVVFVVENVGKKPAFMVNFNITGIKRAFFASDNYFWLAPGEKREVKVDMLFREHLTKHNVLLTVQAWNSKQKKININVKKNN
ncbi:MAG: glycoside hydrolase family 2 protein [Paludibacter sp.]|nr:glycoside hydrolase family 2 protein [Paludibacter sp.]